MKVMDVCLQRKGRKTKSAMSFRSTVWPSGDTVLVRKIEIQIDWITAWMSYFLSTLQSHRRTISFKTQIYSNKVQRAAKENTALLTCY